MSTTQVRWVQRKRALAEQADSNFKQPKRHCERSEAIHAAASKKEWIASSLRSSQ
jgi:hypothetical protein